MLKRHKSYEYRWLNNTQSFFDIPWIPRSNSDARGCVAFKVLFRRWSRCFIGYGTVICFTIFDLLNVSSELLGVVDGILNNSMGLSIPILSSFLLMLWLAGEESAITRNSEDCSR